MLLSLNRGLGLGTKGFRPVVPGSKSWDCVQDMCTAQKLIGSTS